MRDCVGSWRLTQRVRGREGGDSNGGGRKEAEGDREG